MEEHVWFYASLKGMQKERIQEEIDQLILDVGLPHKRHDQSKKLSGTLYTVWSATLPWCISYSVEAGIANAIASFKGINNTSEK